MGTLGSRGRLLPGSALALPGGRRRTTILLCAAALAALGLAGLALGRGRSRAGAAASAVVLLVSLGLGGWASASGLPLRTQDGQLAEVESAYQSIRVAEEDALLLEPSDYPLYGEEMTARTRFLRHDEDHETYQSVWLPDESERLLTGGRYYEHLALGAWFDGIAREGTLRVLVIGYAGGSVHRVLRLTKPEEMELRILGVEIDPAVVRGLAAVARRRRARG